MISWIACAWAAEVGASAFVPQPIFGRPAVELRGGLDHAATPLVCGEVHVLAFLALDACGTGSSWFHQRALDEMSHYRAEASMRLHGRGRAEWWLQPGFGFAEVQRGADAPGFRTRPGPTPEAAGPELTASTKGRWWVHRGVSAVAEVNVAAAWVPAAPEVLALPELLPSASISVGVGF